MHYIEFLIKILLLYLILQSTKYRTIVHTFISYTFEPVIMVFYNFIILCLLQLETNNYLEIHKYLHLAYKNISYK